MDPIRTALVTGANRGIGYAIARGLARAGLRVILTARDLAQGSAAARALATDGDVRAVQLDVDDPASVARLRDTVGPVDVLVNNAGILVDKGQNTLDMPPALLQQTLATNVYGPLLTCQTFMPGMLERGYGRVVMVSSESGTRDGQRTSQWPAYFLSKYTLNGLTLQLSGLVTGDVLVNAMCPGWVHSDMGGPNAPRTLDEGADTAVWLATLPAGGPNGGFFRDRRPLAW